MATKYTNENRMKGFYFWNTRTIKVYRTRNNCMHKYPYHIFSVHGPQNDKRHSHHGELEML